ncbi:hypothetical protein [Chryseobacterium sp. Mn2064]|uniref:hypothetical protein n=1 Tax=Chryseobacterium sp. Mn2064 TaxID=3395263 RepID=UPI003BDDF3EB
MKFTLQQHIITLTLLLSFSLSFGQKVEFTVPQDIEALQNIIFSFKNEFTNDDPKAAAADDDNFSTTIDLYNLKYDKNIQNPYLHLALKKGAKPKQFIEQANWKITFDKISKKSTKVSIFLERVVPDRFSQKEVDTKLTKSTGKVEQEIKEFLLNGKESKAIENSDDMIVNIVEGTADPAVDFEKRNAIEKVASKKLQNLFNKKQFIPLPTTRDVITKLLQIQPNELECKDCKNGTYASWDIDEVFNLILTKLNDGQEYYALQYYGDKKVAGLPYGLVFNESSPSECKAKFAKYNAQLYQTTVDTGESSSTALTVVTFKINTSFIRLEFGNDFLTRIFVSNKDQ